MLDKSSKRMSIMKPQIHNNVELLDRGCVQAVAGPIVCTRM